MKNSDLKQLMRSLDILSKDFSSQNKTDLVHACGLIIDYCDQNLIHDRSEQKNHESVPAELETCYDFGLFSDGACRGNPGPGAWACFATNFQGEEIFQLSSFHDSVTNNVMELTAVACGIEEFLQWLSEHDQYSAKAVASLHIYSDSQYVCKGINEWLATWKSRGWRKADGKTPDHIHLWQKIDLLRSHRLLAGLKCYWVKGHAGHPQNEYCDRLCNEILDREA